jgi:hypothetical protein
MIFRSKIYTFSKTPNICRNNISNGSNPHGAHAQPAPIRCPSNNLQPYSSFVALHESAIGSAPRRRESSVELAFGLENTMDVRITPKSTQHTGMSLSTEGSVAAWEVTFHLDGDESLHAAISTFTLSAAVACNSRRRRYRHYDRGYYDSRVQFSWRLVVWY